MELERERDADLRSELRSLDRFHASALKRITNKTDKSSEMTRLAFALYFLVLFQAAPIDAAPRALVLKGCPPSVLERVLQTATQASIGDVGLLKTLPLQRYRALSKDETTQLLAQWKPSQENAYVAIRTATPERAREILNALPEGTTCPVMETQLLHLVIPRVGNTISLSVFRKHVGVCLFIYTVTAKTQQLSVCGFVIGRYQPAFSRGNRLDWMK